MSPPTERFSRLSLESMPPKTRLQSRSRPEDSSSDSESSSSDSGFDEATGTIAFPSKLSYNLDKLDEDDREHVIETINSTPQLVVQGCQARDQYVIFQVAELVEYNIRTGAVDSDYAIPSCTCEDASPCRHSLWLIDQITKEILDDQGKPLTLTRNGYSAELGNPFEMISEFHLDMLADSLHCDVMGTSSDLNPHRVLQIREILASLNSIPIDEYRPDIFNNPKRGKRVVKKGDLECTLFRMLLRNNELFNYFLSTMKADELVNNPFRQLEQRAETALVGLNSYLIDPTKADPRKPKNVAWCATHLTLVMQQVYSTIQHTKKPLASWELRGAARTLIYILQKVAEHNKEDTTAGPSRRDRSLYFRLIGDKDRDFVIGTLNQLPPEATRQHVETLDAIEQEILRKGAPPSYVEKLRSLIARLRSSGSSSSSGTAGSKRQGQGQDRRAKRMK